MQRKIPQNSEAEILAWMQRQLADIYAIPEVDDVRNFVIPEPTYRLFAMANGLDPQARENVILCCHEDNSVDFGLYFDNGILKNLCLNPPQDGLNERNLVDFLTLVEGVSHFLYISFRTLHELPTSALELELQAEIDKFITSFIFRQHPHDDHSSSRDLHEMLFERFQFSSTIDETQRERYEVASETAAKFCRYLESEFLRPKVDWPGLFTFLRKFYRQSGNNKFSAITSATF